jgi:DNA invertase Pin-like site-specific DNA recombinase
MKVAIYCRVSKDEMSDSGKLQNTDNQLIPLRKFCDAMSYEVAGEFIDRSSGGDSNRPEFQKMLGQVRQRRFDMILIWRLDRFSREGITNTMSYINQLRQYKTALKSLNESWLDTSQEGITELVLSVMAWASAEERKKISQNTKAGLQRARAEGKRCGRHPLDCQCPKHRKQTPPPATTIENKEILDKVQTDI